MNNFNCIDDSSYDIITETNTGGYIHMNNKDLYLLLDKDTKEIFEDYIKKDKNCIELLLRICKHKSYGVGLYAFSIDNKDYMKEDSVSDYFYTYSLIQVLYPIHFDIS